MKKLLLLSAICAIGLRGGDSVSDEDYAALPPVFEFDNFDRCMLLGDEALYCYIKFHLKPIDPKNPSKTWRDTQELSSNEINYRHDILRHGLCVPQLCPNITKTPQDPDFKKELADCYNKKHEHLGVYGTIEHTSCQTNEPKKMDYFDRTVLVILIAYVLFVIYASFYEGLARFRSPEEYKKITSTQYGQILSCFSLPKNWIRLKTVESTPENERFRCFQGVRFYNMFLVILVHSIMLALAGPVSNTKFAETITDHPLTIFLASGPFAVSTFFQISAALLTYGIFKQYGDKNGKNFDIKTLLWIVLYRYIRLTPAMAVILIFHSSLLYHVGQGPMWDEFLRIDLHNCRTYGWTNFLYLNTWINTSQMCLVETWYLSTDMQAFILVLVLLYFTVKNPKQFWLFLIGGWILNNAHLAWYFYKEKIYHCLSPSPENMYVMQALYEDDGVWAKTLAYFPFHLSGTFVGAGLGFILYKYDNSQFLTSKTRIAIWWASIYGAGIGIVCFPGMWIFSKSYYDSFWFSIPYMTFATTIFSLSIAFGIAGVTQGHGWLMKRIMEWPPVYYLGRISYTTYLAHYPLLFYFLASNKHLMHVDDFDIACKSVMVLSLSLIFGFILSMIVEYPTSALSSLFLKKKMLEEANKNDLKQKSS